MSREEDVKDARLFDLRTVERNIKRGIITRKDYERYLKSLADVSEKVAASEPEAAPSSPSVHAAPAVPAPAPVSFAPPVTPVTQE